jgi:epsin
MIYKRFTEKAAEEWRQIYKALQLLEFLIKNGSERVIDDARSHLTLLKMLRQFHFIDQNGKDQGVNVRNRAKELTELLSDVERIRAERKKARATRSKYSGVEGGTGLGSGLGLGGISSNSRYRGFGSDDHGVHGSGYGGHSGGVYGDGGGFGGQSSEFQDSGSRADKFEEYDEYDEGAVAASGRRQADTSSSSKNKRPERASKKPESPKKKEPEVDLFSFDDPVPASTASLAPTTASNAVDDDEFDDFQSATPAPQAVSLSSLSVPALPLPVTTSTTTSFTQFASPQPVSAPKAANLSDLVGFSSVSPATSNSATPVNYSAFSPPAAAAQPRPAGYQGSQPNYFTSVPAPNLQATITTASTTSTKPADTKVSSGTDAFGALWSSASVGIRKTNTPTAGPALGQLAKEKASAGIWGASSAHTQQKPAQGQQQQFGGGLGDLLG